MINHLFQRVRNELESNLLPFWLKYSPDPVYGGFIGGLTNDLKPIPDAPKGLIQHTRLLWAFSAAARFTENSRCAVFADAAFSQLQEHFWDSGCGGAYWTLHPDGSPHETVKKTYGQAFFIYAMVEYNLLTRNPDALERAKTLFGLIETHARDDRSQGYFEVFERDWTFAACQQLSDVDLDAPFSMNTHLHLLEAYTHLYAVWKDPLLEQRLRGLVRLFLERILDAETAHFRLFFDMDWQSLSRQVSYGHDIEGGWLLCRAAEILGERPLQEAVDQAAVQIADATLAEGLSEHHGLVYESDGDGHTTEQYHFWCQPEAVVGFVNAFQLTGQTRYLDAADKLWQFIETYQTDKEYGEWFSKLDAQLKPDLSLPKISQWKCPYHNVRACIEIMQRLENLLPDSSEQKGKVCL